LVLARVVAGRLVTDVIWQTAVFLAGALLALGGLVILLYGLKK
jgi:hypothetical protein